MCMQTETSKYVQHVGEHDTNNMQQIVKTHAVGSETQTNLLQKLDVAKASDYIIGTDTKEPEGTRRINVPRNDKQ